VTLPYRTTDLPREITQGRLLKLAALFLFIQSSILTFSPAVRNHSLDRGMSWGHWAAMLIWMIAVNQIRREIDRHAPNSDPLILPLAAILIGWGMLTIWRLAPEFGLRQSVWLGLGTLLFIRGLRSTGVLSLLRRYKYLWLTLGLGLTGLTLLFGTNPLGNGARLWLGCCGIYLQPSEPLKLLLIIFLAAYLADQQPLNPKLLPLLAPTAVMTGLALLLLTIQRDLGTASIFVFIYTAIIYSATLKPKILLLSSVALSITGIIGYKLFDLVRIRVDAWINPWVDPSGRSYQIVQSLMAVANGGILGRGLGLGNPGLVPIPHSDFIYSSIVEESGITGAVALILILALIVSRCLKISMAGKNAYARYLAIGIATYLAAQSILIIGGNIRLLPLTGVTLPLVSYGGSSLITSLAAVLILIKISHASEEADIQKTSIAPAILLGKIFTLGYICIALVTGWWGIARSQSLLTRTDNPRRAIADRYVMRGQILDRDGEPIAITVGTSGDYQRQYLVPAANAVVGYTHPVYGQAGLEASLDTILRGLTFHPAVTLWSHQLLYGQPPPGSDVRLSISTALQTKANQLLQGVNGAVVILDSQTGEILALASQPTINPNLLSESWQTIVQDENAPLVNRATLGSFAPGAILGPLLYMQAVQSGVILPPVPTQLQFEQGSLRVDCAQPVNKKVDWIISVTSGCPAAITVLGQALGSNTLLELYTNLGFFTAPQIRLATTSQINPGAIGDPNLAALGLPAMRISPLQLALAAATINNHGQQPAARIAISADSLTNGSHNLHPLGVEYQVFDRNTANAILEEYTIEELNIWQAVSVIKLENGQELTWFVGGTGKDFLGRKITIVILIEKIDPSWVIEIGQHLLMQTAYP